jgi:pyruvate dehydrogenase E1 component beta subunit
MIRYVDAIRDALETAMSIDDRVVVIGEGVPDPKGIFGSTVGLQERFGKNRVFDMPLIENAATGICVGAAMSGLRPILTHQRIDFALLSMDQIVNVAAKISYMFNGQLSAPLVIRAIIGRGWGQGPQHSQSLQAMFSHVPGLRVVMPATPVDAKGMMLSAIWDDSPVLFLEHRWLHNLADDVPSGDFRTPLSGARVMHEGSDVTVAAFGYSAIESLRAARVLVNHGVSVEVLDMRVANPVDVDSVIQSVRKTGRLIAVDTGWESGGLAESLVGKTAVRISSGFKSMPIIVASPDGPVPTSISESETYYKDAPEIAEACLRSLARVNESPWFDEVRRSLRGSKPLDVPHLDFVGPF